MIFDASESQSSGDSDVSSPVSFLLGIVWGAVIVTCKKKIISIV